MAVAFLAAIVGRVPSVQAMDGVCVKFCDDAPSSSSSGGGYRGGGGGGFLFNRGPTPEQRNSQLHGEGLAAFRAGDYAKAVRLFEEALDAAFDPVTKLMLVRSREFLAYESGKQANDSQDYARALRFMREALQLATAELELKQTDNAARRVENFSSWIKDLEGRVREQDEERRWDSALGDTKGRVNAVLDDLQNKIAASDDFISPSSPASTGGGLSFMAPGSEAFKDAPKDVSATRVPSGEASTNPSLSFVDSAFVDPGQIQASPYGEKGLKINPVPSPTPKAITDAWVRMNAQKPPDMILEAINKSSGDLHQSVVYMRDRLVKLNPQDREAREALSYLEALQQAEITYLDSIQPESDSKHLMGAILQSADDMGEDEGLGTWHAARNFTVVRALDAGGGNVDAALQFLVTNESVGNEDTRKAAIRYLQGMSAYQDWAKSTEHSGTK
jgi:tetratricopeptide (TPR) repeat protein